MGDDGICRRREPTTSGCEKAAVKNGSLTVSLRNEERCSVRIFGYDLLIEAFVDLKLGMSHQTIET